MAVIVALIGFMPAAASDSDASTVVPDSRRSRATRSSRDGLMGRLTDLPLWGKLAVAIPTILVVSTLVAAAGDLAVSAGRVHPGVTVSGVAVGGLTPEDAESRLRGEMDRRLAKPVVIRVSDATLEVLGSAIDARVDVRKSVERAFIVGREADPWRAVTSRFSAVVGGIDMPATMDTDPAETSALMDRLDERVARPARDARVLIEGARPRLVGSSKGRSVRRAQMTRDLLTALASARRTITVVVGSASPRVSDSDAAQALADAEDMLSGPVGVRWEKRTWTFAPDTIARWIVFLEVPAGSSTTSSAGAISSATVSSAATGTAGGKVRMMLRAALDAGEVSATVSPLTGGIGRPAKEAKFVVEGGRVTVAGGRIGLGPDIASLTLDLERAIRSGGDRRTTLRLSALAPSLTAEKARAMGIIERVSTYSTTFSSGATQRVNNIRTLAKALDGKLVAPGAVFDFNAAVGERTAAKGYQEAPAIVDGKLVPQLGGGICQIGTTFFNAVFFSGLPVVERKNHSFYISHYPKGRDCTVTWGGANLRWKNDTESWILIKTASSHSSVTISLYGTDPGYDVEYKTGPFSNVRPHGKVEVKDPKLPVGAKVVEEGGIDGGTVKVVRTVTKDGRPVRTDTFMSHYNPKAEIIRAGTKTKVKRPRSSPTPTSTPSP